ncbi:FGFR1 oncogene partner-like isoform X2 [Zootermopsis nevadensis]|uniref:FGFR1 oncogene partner-like isoform X2 n=1 Tax=Zootermopsis nevadensis TaxID=136037 RepID=UPI000B8E304F|nr:FGFR1 oncogene partner-like isoform X2 [Zootermopsis nevadensis]
MSEEETELRDLVAQTLENNGVLSKIRAELRASVFLALEEQESLTDTPQFTNKPLRTFLSTDEGSLVACLVREFLEFFQLDFTLSVFDPETAQGKYYNYGGRSKLINDLQIQNLNGKKGPLLVQLLHIALSQNVDYSGVKQEGTEPNIGMNISSALGNQIAHSGALLDSNTPNSAIGERTSAQRNVAETSKLSTDIYKVLRLKDIPLPAVLEQMSPRSTSVSDSEHANHSSKNASKSKTVSSETTPHNSPTLEQSLTQSKPETQAAPNSDSIQKSSSKSDSKKNKPQQINKSNVECITRAGTTTLSSLSNLPPLFGVNLPMKQTTGSLPGISHSKDMHKIKSMIDLGLESQDNYDEDFNSSASVSAKDDPANQATDTEIEEELGSGVEDILSSNSVLDDMTADATLSNLTGVADYMEDVM